MAFRTSDVVARAIGQPTRGPLRGPLLFVHFLSCRRTDKDGNTAHTDKTIKGIPAGIPPPFVWASLHGGPLCVWASLHGGPLCVVQRSSKAGQHNLYVCLIKCSRQFITPKCATLHEKWIPSLSAQNSNLTAAEYKQFRTLLRHRMQGLYVTCILIIPIVLSVQHMPISCRIQDLYAAYSIHYLH